MFERPLDSLPSNHESCKCMNCCFTAEANKHQLQSAPLNPHSDVWTLVCLRSQTLCFPVTQQVCLKSSCWFPGPGVPSSATITGPLSTATSVLVWTRSLKTSPNSGEFGLDSRFCLQTRRRQVFSLEGVSAPWLLTNQEAMGGADLFFCCFFCLTHL